MRHFACFLVTLLLAGILAPPAAAQDTACGDTTPVVLFPPTHELVLYDLATVTSVSAVSAQILRITQDEPVGREGFDAAISSPAVFQVRAERDGYGDGRVYHVIYLVDGVECDLSVMVPTRPNRLAVDSGEQACIGVGC